MAKRRKPKGKAVKTTGKGTQPSRAAQQPKKRVSSRVTKAVEPVEPAPEPLTPLQQCFVDEFLLDLNATQAAVRAGYSEKTARQIGSENLSKPVIQAAIQDAMSKRSARVEVKADDVLRELKRIGFSDLSRIFRGGRLLRLEEVDEDVRRSIAAIDVVTRSVGEGDVEHVAKIKAWDKPGALIAMGKHLGLFAADNARDVNLKGSVDINAIQKKADAEVKQLTDEELKELTPLAQELLARMKGKGAQGALPAGS